MFLGAYIGATWPAWLGTLPALVGTSGVNSYGGMLCGTTIVDGFRRIRPTVRVRVVGLILVGAVAALVTIIMPANYLSSFNTFLSILVYLLIPWSAVNLADFYLVRKGHYSIENIVDPRGSYGLWACPSRWGCSSRAASTYGSAAINGAWRSRQR